MTHKLAVITVIYENYNVFTDFLKSLQRQSDKNFHLFILDVSINKQPLSIKDIENTLISTKNLGYADGVNHGLKEAQKQGFEQFCIMNYDTFFERDFVKSVKDGLVSHPGSIVGGKIYYAPGFEYHKEIYQKAELGKVIWFAGGSIDWDHVVTPHIGVDEVDDGQYDKDKKVEFITGCLMCFDKTVLNKVGYWDKSYFLYYEDSDYCVRAAQKGINLYYIPKIVIWHKNGQITEGPGSKFHQKYQDKNRIIFGLKYAPFQTKIHLLKNLFLENKTNK